MGFVENTSFNPDVKNWSYTKIIDVFGENIGGQVAKHFGIEKRTFSKKKKDKSAGDDVSPFLADD